MDQKSKLPGTIMALVAAAVLLAAGLVVLRNFFFADLFQYLMCNVLNFDVCTRNPASVAALCKMASHAVGLAAVLASIYLVFSRIAGARADEYVRNHYRIFLIVIVTAVVAVVLAMLLKKFFEGDEFEHIHSAYYIAQGKLPYKDFFEHHHPLLWYSIVPVLWIMGENTAAVIALRVLMFFAAAGIIIVTYRIAEKTSGSREVGLFSIVILLSAPLFVKSVEVRPDVPQVLFGILSIYYFIRYFEANEKKFMIYSGLAAAISFLFLQKAVVLLAAYGAVFIFLMIRRGIPVSAFFLFAGSFMLPCLAYFAYLAGTGSLRDYYLMNWVLNKDLNVGTGAYVMEQGVGLVSRFEPLKKSLVQSPFFWPISAAGALYCLISKRSGRSLKLLVFIGLMLFFFTAAVRVPHRQYFMFSMPILSVAGAYFLEYLFDRLNAGGKGRILVALVILAVPTVVYLKAAVFDTNGAQLEKVDYVLENSESSDLVYDGLNDFNLFRDDVHYLWYLVRESLDVYNKVTGGRYADYDICKIIKEKKPKFISDLEIDFETCDLAGSYIKTDFDDLLVRKDQ